MPSTSTIVAGSVLMLDARLVARFCGLFSSARESSTELEVVVGYM
jgi:hypothetical protein